MPHPGLVAVLSRFWLAVAGSLAGGWLVFRHGLFQPETPPFQCVTVGAVVAGVITLVRLGRPGYGLAIAIGFGLFRWGWVDSAGWLAAASGFVIGLGIFLVAVIVELLRRRGLVFGKFLVAGPLIGGVLLAAAPLIEFRNFALIDASATFLEHGFVGLVIGDGAALGVEIVDVLDLAFSRRSAPLAGGEVPGVVTRAGERDG